FLGILTGEEKLLEFAFEAEGFGERDFGAGNDGALDAADGARSLVGRTELPGIGEHVFPKVFLFVDIMDEAHFEGFLEAERAARGHELDGARAANGAGKTLRAASAGKNAKIDFGQTDLAAFFFGDADVAGEGNLQATAYSVAIESRDDQLGCLFEARECFVGMEAEVI